ncbi:SDR family NAD(P)-dependent oxidoreductase [Phenylobacterium sp.]|uniref:SDR family NAD(P)-dependent oxidoreductase n=1 Tax=Phenylobacterium sp. TaxID=1871053 RepID=UPI00272FCBCD|nr:SDR family NAD(P)-dependent oxidoreductase [Phenylobacterium sp.]MDP1618984.1 SDR family NAD(P)-dependent oxidoreductase [Phenylobacterium sp.]MDP1989300.1 SDR family NAD(P)-dependent oxidoreductase [Phenylobacterium sp.]
MGTSVVVGASGGLGAAVLTRLAAERPGARLLALSRQRPEGLPPQADWARLDLTDEASIAAAAEALGAGESVDLVFVATGQLHGPGLSPEKSWRSLDPDALMAAFQVNAVGPALVAKHFLPRLARDRRAVFAALSARVGSIGDNRLGGWHGYRASKAALNQMIRTLAIELARQRPQAICVALHPGTVDTALSAPFQGGVAHEKLFTPDFAAEQLLAVLGGLTPADSGGFFAWDGTSVPW